jgi:resuscitation-promoting factor RpfB
MSALAQKRIDKLGGGRLLSAAALRLGVSAVGLLLLWGGWAATAHPVVVTVDGFSETVYTHRRTVDALLLDLGLEVQLNDRVEPGLSMPIHNGLNLVVERARPFRILADGRETVVASWGATAAAVLADAGIAIDHYDRVLAGDRLVRPGDLLPAPGVTLAPVTYDRGYDWKRLQAEPRLLRVQRAAPITVDDGNLPFTIRTTATTIGEALREAEITLYLGDRVQPSLGSQVSTGLRVFIERSKPVAFQMNGRLFRTRTRAKTVGDALTELKVGVSGSDRVSPGLEAPLVDNTVIAITRVREEIAVTEEIIPFETAFEPDPNLAIDTQQVVHPGAVGINRRRYRVRYEDGQEVARNLLDSWVAQDPARRLIAYGQLVEPKTATMADGTQITYWRRMRAYASSYSAATAGVARTNPNYGRTRTGDLMRNGIIAVDPRVIPLRSKTYVTGYGFGDALDTGSGIIGRHVDLGYADEDLVMWNRWVDVYLLWPPPPRHQITWVLPNHPRE